MQGPCADFRCPDKPPHTSQPPFAGSAGAGLWELSTRAVYVLKGSGQKWAAGTTRVSFGCLQKQHAGLLQPWSSLLCSEDHRSPTSALGASFKEAEITVSG